MPKLQAIFLKATSVLGNYGDYSVPEDMGVSERMRSFTIRPFVKASAHKKTGHS